MSIPTNTGGGDDRGGLALDRLVSAAHRGQMPKLGAATATRAGLTIAGYGGDAAIGLDAATAALAGALTAADKTKLDAMYRALPACRVFNSANIAVPNATSTVLTFDSERLDTHAFHSTTVNPGRLTVPTGLAGLYLFGATVIVAPAVGGGRRIVTVQVNGTHIGSNELPPTALVNPSMTPVALYPLADGQFMEVAVYQDSGGALNASVFSADSLEFWCVRLGD